MTTEQKVIKIEDILGEFGFTIRWEILPHWVDVVAFEKVATELGDTPRTLYERKGAKSSEDHVYDIDGAEWYLSGYVKWDGCTELDMGSPHWCGLDGHKKHCDLLQYIYTRSQQLMGKADVDLFGGPWQSADAVETHNAL
jgi:hypothetical protein